MRLKILVSIAGPNINYAVGDEVDHADTKDANRLIQAGVATLLPARAKQKSVKAPAAETAAKAAAPGKAIKPTAPEMAIEPAAETAAKAAR